MTARVWLYTRLMTHPGLNTLINQRVFAKKSMKSSIEQHPYLVYKLGYSANEDLAETELVSRQFVQVFIHDYADGEVADYMRIDEVIREIKDALINGQSAEDQVMTARYLETSQDLNDETLNTVMKYLRFQLITKEK